MLIAVLLIGVLGWWHGRRMYELGVEQGRLDERHQQLTRHLLKEQAPRLELLRGGRWRS